MKRTRWYKDGVFYQIWPRSFKDGNGDGMGDLYGVYEKLDYLKSLGVTTQVMSMSGSRSPAGESSPIPITISGGRNARTENCRTTGTACLKAKPGSGMKFGRNIICICFREDVITFISKREGLPDASIPAMRGILHYNLGPRLHEFLTQFRREAFSDYDCVTIAESALITPEKALEFITESDDNELDMVIQFQCMCADCLFTDFVPMKFSLYRLKNAFSTWQEKLEGKAWNMLYLENHDHPRIISRYGSEQFRVQSGKMLCAMYLFQKGTPFIYQGQEIGMVNWRAESVSQYEDVQTVNHCPHWPEDKRLRLYHRASRDNARTPVQWDNTENAGFTTGKPWFTVNPNYREINVAAAEADPDSLLHFYRKAIRLRKELPAVRYGKYREYFRFSGKFYVYAMESESQRVLVICSFSHEAEYFRAPKNYDLAKGRLILYNYGTALRKNGFTAMPYETRVYVFD